VSIVRALPVCSGANSSNTTAHRMARQAQSEVAVLQKSRRGHAKSFRTMVLFVPALLATAIWPSSVTYVRELINCLMCGPHPGVQKVVQLSMPGAVSSYKLLPKILKALEPHQITPQNTIYGQSICSDEINNEKGQISELLSKYYGKVFPMGGIGGAPYVGKTGFGAFSAHVPDNGNVFVLFGPHIGFSPDSVAGKFLRIGQRKPSTACGAVIAAYNQVTSGEDIPDDPADMEQSWLRNRLKPHAAEIADSNNLMVALVLKAYKEIEKEVLKIVNTNYGPGNLVLLGGIQINMPYPSPGFFLPLHFTIRSSSTHVQDLIPLLG